MQVKKQQLELDMKQWTASKSGKDHVKAVSCHPYLTIIIHGNIGERRASLVARTVKCRRLGFSPWVGKIPWRREWLTTPIFLTGEFHVQRSLAGCDSWGCKELDTTE